MLLIVTFLTVIPVGMVWARVEHLSLREVSRESEDLARDEGAPQSAKPRKWAVVASNRLEKRGRSLPRTAAGCR